MPHQNLVLSLSRKRHQPGDTISGTVRLETTTGARFRRVEVFTEWSLRRAARFEGGRGATITLPVRELAPWTFSEHAFELDAPRGPLSYEGPAVAIEWRVVARAELPWALGARATAPFALELGSDDDPLPMTGDYRHAPRTRPSDYVFGSAPLRERPSIDRTRSSTLPFEDAWRALKSACGRVRRGRGLVISLPERVRRGERFEVRAAFGAGAAAVPRSCEVRVIGQEVARVRTVDGYTSHEVELVHFDVADAKLEGREFSASFRMPSGVPPTFSGRSADIRYNVQIECGSPAWRTERALFVRP